jgi:hypothetical protein
MIRWRVEHQASNTPELVSNQIEISETSLCNLWMIKYLRKKWKRSVTRSMALAPVKKACRARDMSRLSESLNPMVKLYDSSTLQTTHSERTANDTDA